MILSKSFLKAIIWEASSFLLLLLLSGVMLGAFQKITLLAVIYVLVKIPLFVIHEKLWSKVI